MEPEQHVTAHKNGVGIIYSNIRAYMHNNDYSITYIIVINFVTNLRQIKSIRMSKMQKTIISEKAMLLLLPIF